MSRNHRTSRVASFILLALVFSCASVLLTGCSTRKDQAFKTVERHLTALGLKEIKFDLFQPHPEDSSRSYVSVTVTHDFASASGRPQREFLGFIVKEEEGQWSIENPAAYTIEKDRAIAFLEGRKQ